MRKIIDDDFLKKVDYLYYGENLTGESIAERLCCSTVTVYKTLKILRKKRPKCENIKQVSAK